MDTTSKRIVVDEEAIVNELVEKVKQKLQVLKSLGEAPDYIDHYLSKPERITLGAVYGLDYLINELLLANAALDTVLELYPLLKMHNLRLSKVLSIVDYVLSANLPGLGEGQIELRADEDLPLLSTAWMRDKAASGRKLFRILLHLPCRDIAEKIFNEELGSDEYKKYVKLPSEATLYFNKTLDSPADVKYLYSISLPAPISLASVHKAEKKLLNYIEKALFPRVKHEYPWFIETADILWRRAEERARRLLDEYLTRLLA